MLYEPFNLQKIKTMAISFDLNADVGESTHEHPEGQDEALMPYLTSCNIACGFHGGDPVFLQEAIRLAIKHHVRIGAHPSYPDRANFGRSPMALPEGELIALVQYQVSALGGMVEAAGSRLAYVKPHGALYHAVSFEEEVALPFLEALRSLPRARLPVMGLAGSPLEGWAAAAGIGFIPEGFADRRYTPEGRLVPRTVPGAVLSEPEEAVRQVQALQGQGIESYCVHGDNPAALSILQALHSAQERGNPLPDGD